MKHLQTFLTCLATVQTIATITSCLALLFLRLELDYRIVMGSMIGSIVLASIAISSHWWDSYKYRIASCWALFLIGVSLSLIHPFVMWIYSR